MLRQIFDKFAGPKLVWKQAHRRRLFSVNVIEMFHKFQYVFFQLRIRPKIFLKFYRYMRLYCFIAIMISSFYFYPVQINTQLIKVSAFK